MESVCSAEQQVTNRRWGKRHFIGTLWNFERGDFKRKVRRGMAEREGFEPSVSFTPHTISSRAPSAARTSLRTYAIKIFYYKSVHYSNQGIVVKCDKMKQNAPDYPRLRSARGGRNWCPYRRRRRWPAVLGLNFSIPA
jgi:hypothetical protein